MTYFHFAWCTIAVLPHLPLMPVTIISFWVMLPRIALFLKLGVNPVKPAHGKCGEILLPTFSGFFRLARCSLAILTKRCRYAFTRSMANVSGRNFESGQIHSLRRDESMISTAIGIPDARLIAAFNASMCRRRTQSRTNAEEVSR